MNELLIAALVLVAVAVVLFGIDTFSGGPHR